MRGLALTLALALLLWPGLLAGAHPQRFAFPESPAQGRLVVFESFMTFG